MKGISLVVMRVRETARLGRRVVELEREAGRLGRLVAEMGRAMEAQQQETAMLKRLVADELRLRNDEMRLLRGHFETLLERVSAMNARLVERGKRGE